MNRFIVCALLLAVPNTMAFGQEPNVTLWLQGRDGSNFLDLGVSETAVIQLWMTVGTNGGNNPLVVIDAFLTGYNALAGKDLSFEVSGFNDLTIPNSQMQRISRGSISAELPNGSIDSYRYIAQDPLSSTGTDGLGFPYPRTVLLDEIIIHEIATTPNGPDQIFFAFGGQAPTGFYLAGPNWDLTELGSVTLGTGSAADPFLVLESPEPTTLVLLTFGALCTVRRRQ